MIYLYKIIKDVDLVYSLSDYKEENNMKKLLIFLTGILFTLLSCSGTDDRSSVQDSFEKSMNNLQSGNFIMKSSESQKKLFSEAYKKMTYKVIEVTKEDEKNILIKVQIRIPDLSGIDTETENAVREKRKKMGISESDKEVQEIIINSYHKKLLSADLKYNNKIITVKYIKKGNEWYLAPDDTELWDMLRLGTEVSLKMDF